MNINIQSLLIENINYVEQLLDKIQTNFQFNKTDHEILVISALTLMNAYIPRIEVKDTNKYPNLLFYSLNLLAACYWISCKFHIDYPSLFYIIHGTNLHKQTIIQVELDILKSFNYKIFPFMMEARHYMEKHI
jgi:hypothetical protein